MSKSHSSEYAEDMNPFPRGEELNLIIYPRALKTQIRLLREERLQTPQVEANKKMMAREYLIPANI